MLGRIDAAQETHAVRTFVGFQVVCPSAFGDVEQDLKVLETGTVVENGESGLAGVGDAGIDPHSAGTGSADVLDQFLDDGDVVCERVAHALLERVNVKAQGDNFFLVHVKTPCRGGSRREHEDLAGRNGVQEYVRGLPRRAWTGGGGQGGAGQ